MAYVNTVMYIKKIACLAVLSLLTTTAVAQVSYQNFNAAVYVRYYEVQQMSDATFLENSWSNIGAHVKVSKIYLETHRDRNLIDADTLQKAIDFFHAKGLAIAGGITLTISEPKRFETFCYSNPEHRAWVKKVVEFTAQHFDELILDDFFFTSCKSDIEIKAKGKQSWTEYRLKLLSKAAEELIIKPAKKINPNIKVVVKYPNWYEHFQGLGFNLETEPHMFDGIYTGTETRDAVRSAQHLQPYLGYQIFRYFNNLRPGHNGGGWVDTGGATSLDRYAEQLWLTLFAKAPEITLFDYRQLQAPVSNRLRGAWQNKRSAIGYGIRFDEMISSFSEGSSSESPPFSYAAGQALELVDGVLSELGNPIGVKSYRPFHATGEDFLHNYLGMIGIPIDLLPQFPSDAHTVLLTESAKFDQDIVKKIEQHIRQGNNVVVTSGLLAALQERGIKQIAEIEVSSRKALVKQFQSQAFAPLSSIEEPILIPQVTYLTNDSWELVSAIAGTNGWPLLHDADYSGGHLYVLTIPDNFADLYRLPADVLTAFRQTIANDLDVYLDGPAQVTMFMYDNNTVVVESFLDEPVELGLVTDKNITEIRDLQSGTQLSQQTLPPRGGFGSPRIGQRNRFEFTLAPHTFRVFRY